MSIFQLPLPPRNPGTGGQENGRCQTLAHFLPPNAKDAPPAASHSPRGQFSLHRQTHNPNVLDLPLGQGGKSGYCPGDGPTGGSSVTISTGSEGFRGGAGKPDFTAHQAQRSEGPLFIGFNKLR